MTIRCRDLVYNVARILISKANRWRFFNVGKTTPGPERMPLPEVDDVVDVVGG